MTAIAVAEPPVAGTAPRLAFVDALKAVAVQFIVLHHLAFYGPLSDNAYDLAVGPIVWLSQDGRMAVQAFLVIGGFLAARAMAPGGTLLTDRPLGLLGRRYLQLVAPYLAALVVAIALTALARALLGDHYAIPAPPTPGSLVAHALLLHSILGYDGLSAGVWYIAIDFQLFAMLLGTLWLARRARGARDRVPEVGLLLVTALALASLYLFNRNPELDIWGLYFFGAYALGVLTYWATARGQAAPWLGWVVLGVVAALWLDFRARILVAFAVALALGLARYLGFIETWPRSRWVAALGTISYSVFLIHFPVCLVVGGLVTRFGSEDPWLNLAGMGIAWLASLGAGALFYRLVESPARRRFRLARPAPVHG